MPNFIVQWALYFGSMFCCGCDQNNEERLWRQLMEEEGNAPCDEGIPHYTLPDDLPEDSSDY